jgi:hypothetical protein
MLTLLATPQGVFGPSDKSFGKSKLRPADRVVLTMLTMLTMNSHPALVFRDSRLFG